MSTSEVETAPPESANTNDASGGKNRRLGTTLALVGAAVVAALGIAFIVRAGEDPTEIESVPTAKVKRGPLTVSVTEGGQLRALESQEIESKVEGNNQILDIVPEGTVVTTEDVENGRVLVKLDASGLEDNKANREIAFANAEASLTQAQENFNIRKKQNESNRSAAELNVKFTRMELARYLGQELADKLLEEQTEFADLDLAGLATAEVQRIFRQKARAAERETSEQNPATANPATTEGNNPYGSERGAQESALAAEMESEVQQAGQAAALGAGYVRTVSAREVLADAYSEPKGTGDTLGGTARQTIRDFAASVLLAGQELQQQEDRLYWTRKLVENEYENESKLEEDLLSLEQRQVNLDAAKEELRLYIRYTLPKDAEQRYSDYIEANRELERVLAQNRSQIAQAEANLRSKRSTFNLEKERLEKTREMIANSTIRATKPGLVVYASTSNPRSRRNNPIQEGANVREHESIISLPDPSTLAARVNIHEVDIAKVKTGQPAVVTCEGLPGKTFEAEVARVSPMASSEHRWLNPDTMVYETDVRLKGTPEELSPGMSATAEVIVADLENCTYVPVQAVTTYKGRRVCWVKRPDGPQVREVETGYFTDKYVEIRNGLREGETVYLAPPAGVEVEAGTEEEEEEERRGRPDRTRSPGEEAARGDAQTEARPEGQQAEKEEEQQERPQIDWAELRKLSPEERREKIEEYMESLPEDQREEMRKRMQQRRGGGADGGERRGAERGGAGQQNATRDGSQQ
ncbi:MAG: efflux RND transporter periplasmic adaptor subunit [Planctomycetota bacterium]